MKEIRIGILAKICLLIFAYIVIYFTYFAFTVNYREGDSIAYHIPIMQAMSHGALFNPFLYNPHATMEFSPAVGESLLLFISFVHLPLNIFNVIGVCVLFFVLYKLGRRFGFEKNYAIIFAVSFTTLHTVIRWISAQTIDTWLAVFFAWTLYLLEKPEKNIKYFFLLGFSSGLLIGIKYSAPAFFLILLIFYIRKLKKYISFSRFFAFLIPFIIVGLSWYLRNYFVTGDPYYPQDFLFFKGIHFGILNTPVWKIIFLYPQGIVNEVNAGISEYSLWMLSIPAVLGFLIISYKKANTNFYKKILFLGGIGILNFFVYLFLPDGPNYSLNVSVFRYTYPAFIPFLLCSFLIAKEYKWEEFLSIAAVSSIIIVSELSYYPKLLFLFIPIAVGIYFLDINKLQIHFFKQKKK